MSTSTSSSASTAAAGGSAVASTAPDAASDSGSQPQRISLKVRTLDQRTYSVTISTDASVPELKAVVAEETGVVLARQRLIFRGKVLKNEEKISTYALEDGHVLHLVVRAENAGPENTPNDGRDGIPRTRTTRNDDPDPRMGGPARNRVVMGATFSIPEGADVPMPFLSSVVADMVNAVGNATAATGTAQADAGSGARTGNAVNMDELLRRHRMRRLRRRSRERGDGGSASPPAMEALRNITENYMRRIDTGLANESFTFRDLPAHEVTEEATLNEFMIQRHWERLMAQIDRFRDRMLQLPIAIREIGVLGVHGQDAPAELVSAVVGNVDTMQHLGEAALALARYTRHVFLENSPNLPTPIFRFDERAGIRGSFSIPVLGSASIGPPTRPHRSDSSRFPFPHPSSDLARSQPHLMRLRSASLGSSAGATMPDTLTFRLPASTIEAINRATQANGSESDTETETLLADVPRLPLPQLDRSRSSDWPRGANSNTSAASNSTTTSSSETAASSTSDGGARGVLQGLYQRVRSTITRGSSAPASPAEAPTQSTASSGQAMSTTTDSNAGLSTSAPMTNVRITTMSVPYIPVFPFSFASVGGTNTPESPSAPQTWDVARFWHRLLADSSASSVLGILRGDPASLHEWMSFAGSILLRGSYAPPASRSHARDWSDQFIAAVRRELAGNSIPSDVLAETPDGDAARLIDAFLGPISSFLPEVLDHVLRAQSASQGDAFGRECATLLARMARQYVNELLLYVNQDDAQLRRLLNAMLVALGMESGMASYVIDRFFLWIEPPANRPRRRRESTDESEPTTGAAAKRRRRDP
ncbi:hypothetical protein PINS_up000326 [Pythium insidiosum]|nr:hypothetical protein PINS_up000326 [Pythium insidiosum]